MIQILSHNWGLFLLAGVVLNIPLAVLFFTRFFQSAPSVLGNAMDRLLSDDSEIREGHEIEDLGKTAMKTNAGMLTDMIRKMWPVYTLGLAVGLLYLGAIVGFISWLIRASVGS